MDSVFANSVKKAILVLGLIAGPLICLVAPASGLSCSITVDGTTIGNRIQLQAAMDTAESNCPGSSDTVTIDVAANLALDGTELVWDGQASLTIDGSVSGATITALDMSTVFSFLSGAGSVLIKDLIITDAVYSAIRSNATELTIQDSTIKESVNIGDYGGAVYVLSGNLVIERSVFTENIADYGGAVATINSSGTTNISDSSFSTNQGGSGGAVYVESNSTEIESTQFSGNVGIAGGALYSDAANLFISESQFEDQTAAFYGGAAYIDNSGSVDIFTSKISRNISGSHGGAIYLASAASFTIGQSELSYNEAEDGDGGAIWNSNESILALNNTITGNRAVNGGGIYLFLGQINSLFNTIFDNTASGLGNNLGLVTSSAILNGTVVGLPLTRASEDNCNAVSSSLESVDSAVTLHADGTADHSCGSLVTGMTAAQMDLDDLGADGNPLTYVHSMMPNTGSLLIGAVPESSTALALLGVGATDQRGEFRTGATTIGAIHVSTTPVTTTSTTTTTTVTTTTSTVVQSTTSLAVTTTSGGATLPPTGAAETLRTSVALALLTLGLALIVLLRRRSI